MMKVNILESIFEQIISIKNRRYRSIAVLVFSCVQKILSIFLLALLGGAFHYWTEVGSASFFILYIKSQMILYLKLSLFIGVPLGFMEWFDVRKRI